MKRRQVLKLSNTVIDKIVKIQGTNYDRKRVLTDKDRKKMLKLYSKGLSVQALAQRFNVSECCVKYNVVPNWKTIFNATRSGLHTGVNNITANDRALYKRTLVKRRKIKTKMLSL